MLQELSDESRRMCIKINITKTEVMVADNTPINVNNVLIENIGGYEYLGQRYSLKENNQGNDTVQRRIMEGRAAWHSQTQGYLQKQPCHLPEETGVQLMFAASNDIWCRDLDTDQTSTEQTCGSTEQDGKKYAQHQIRG